MGDFGMTAVRLTEKDITKYRKRAKKYAEGKGRLNPKWLELPKLDSSFLDFTGSKLSENQKQELYPFHKDTTDELKFRVLALQRLCCLRVSDNQYIEPLEAWMRDILRDSKSLRSKLRINWTDPVEAIVNKMLEDINNEDTD